MGSMYDVMTSLPYNKKENSQHGFAPNRSILVIDRDVFQNSENEKQEK
jgi:hypothetical protein